MAISPSELLELATTTPDPGRVQSGVLAALARQLGADVGLFVTLGPSGIERAELGLAEAAGALRSGWDRYGREILPVQREAQRAGVSTDRRTLGASLERTRLYREVMAPLGGRESLFLVPTFRSRKLGFLMLGSRRQRFSDAQLAEARGLAPCLSVICAALAAPPTAGTTFDGLSESERDLLRYLELGYRSREIATARGTSFFTVRNQLSALYRKLGVTNRTEAVGLRARGA